MINLDDIKAIEKLDRSDVYESVELLPKQCFHAWEVTKNLQIPDSYRQINKIVMTGMGGSGLGARVIEAVFGSKIKYPLVRVNDYNLPEWVDKNTFIICSSFSGTTEETVENARQAQAKGAKWMAIGTGGTLIDLAKKANAPYYQIIPTYNPSKQPRLAMGYSIIGQLAMASKMGVIELRKKDILAIVKGMDKICQENALEVSKDKNPAKKMAEKFYGKKVVFIAARHMLAAGHTIKNQMNENAKNFSALFDIPELNHHLMEGLTFPDSNKKDLLCLLLNSDLYPKRIQQRITITQDIIQKNKIPVLNWFARAGDYLDEAFEFIQFGGFVNFYLAILNGIDPAPIPWVDYFKVKLGQSLGQWK